MFKIYDGYSGPLDKMTRKTQDMTSKVEKASSGTDKFNSKLNNTSKSSASASSGLSSLIGKLAIVGTALKGMSIADEYTNTAARLSLINDGLQTQAELQEKIMNSANASKGSYTDMASAVSKLGLLAGDSFGSNDELIGFTELLQKSLKISGASTAEQSSAMLQLTQAMAAGKLQGDEFRSIMENAPMLADAIAKYMGKTKGELKEMSSQGLITSDIIKNAMFASADDINGKFKEMPYTFADTWTKIKNGGTQAFGELMTKINKLLNSDGFQNFINAVIVGFSMAADVVGWLIDSIISGWELIGPILGIIATVYLINMIIQLWAMVPPLLAQAAAWLAINWPILLIIAVVGILIAAFLQMGGTVEQIVGFVGGIFGVMAANIYNHFVYMWNMVAAFINFFGNVFTNPVASVQALFYDLMVNVIGFIAKIAQAIEDVLNAIPGVEVDITSGLTNIKNSLADKAATIKDENGLKEYVKSKEFMDYSDGYSKGSSIATDGYSKLTGALSGMTSTFGTSNLTSSLGTKTNPVTVQGTGGNGKVEVNMADEDLKYLKDVAERDYINKISSNTLAPNVTITFGDVHETADADKVAGRIKKILQEEIAICSEG